MYKNKKKITTYNELHDNSKTTYVNILYTTHCDLIEHKYFLFTENKQKLTDFRLLGSLGLYNQSTTNND